jgi:hypothetical protein
MSILKGLHRRVFGIAHNDMILSRHGYVSGGEDKPAIVLPGVHDTVALFDDFLGDLVADEWAYVESDTGYSGVLATATNGIFRITGSETQGVTSEAAGALTQGLFKNWKANSGGPKNGRLRLTARVKVGTISQTAEGGRPHVFVGFSDSGGAEFPAYDTGAGVISPAADMAGFYYSASPASGSTAWKLVSVKSTAGDSGDQLVDAASSYAPTSNVYQTLEMEIRSGNSDTGGRAHFWIDGKKVGTIDSPVGSAIALTPWIGMWCQDTGFANTLDIDYVAISAPRDTGE